MSAQNNSYLDLAIADGHAETKGEGKKERIYYLAAEHSERWSDPEEKIRAEFWAELIYKYEYDPKLIKFEVKVPPDRIKANYENARPLVNQLLDTYLSQWVYNEPVADEE